MNLSEIYEASRTRSAKQHALEDAIASFCPDFSEAADLAIALLAGLRNHYDELLGMEHVDIEVLFRDLDEALKEADNTVQVTRYDDEWTEMNHG